MRLAIFALVVALAALGAVPGLASYRDSGTVIGSTSLASNEGTANLTGKNMPVFQGDASGAYVTSSPVTGVISSWSFRSAGVKTGDRFVLRVLSPQDSTGTSWRAVATSRPVAVTSPTGTDAKLGPFTESIPIQKGDRVALQPLDEGYTPIEQGIGGKDGIRYFTGPISDGSTAAIDPGSGADNGQIVPIQATITTGGGGSSIASTGGPTVGGTPAVGSTLSCTGGSWSEKPDSLAFAWLRDGSPITGATTASYAVAAGDAGHALSCKVTAAASGASASAASTAVQVPAASAGPANTAAPKVVGIVKAGSTVRCDPGTWTGNPTFVYAWTWQRSAPFPAFRLALGSRLFGATTGTYYRSAINGTVIETAKIATGATLQVPDLPPDGQLTCTVSISAGSPNAAKAVAATATPAPIQPTPPALARGHDLGFHPPAITAGLGPGSTNTCHPGLWSGYPTFAYDWYSLGPKPTQRFVPRPRKLIWKGPSIKLGAFHEGMTIECTVTATNEAGSAQMSSSAYVVPAAPPQPTNGVFVSVSTESPSGSGGLVGPEGGTAVAEKIHLKCIPPGWTRTPSSIEVDWWPVDASGQLLGYTSVVESDRLDFDMSPGHPGGQTIVACVVFADYGVDQVVEVQSGPIKIWNGCIETTQDDPAHPPDAAVAYTATAVGVLASVASGGLAGALATGIFGSGFSPDLGAPFNSVFGSGSTTVYTTGPNCLDYQKYYEKQGYTVKQRG